MIRILLLTLVVLSFVTFPFWATTLFGIAYILYYQSPEGIIVGLFFDVLSLTGGGIVGITFFFTVVFSTTYFLILLLRERFVAYNR